MELSASEKNIVARVMKPDDSLGPWGSGVLTIWNIFSLLFAGYVAAPWLLLVWFYGFSRVYSEGLHFTYMPTSKSADDYIVSNGEHISTANAFISFPMAVAVWVAMSLAGYLLIRYSSRLQKEARFRKLMKDV